MKLVRAMVEHWKRSDDPRGTREGVRLEDAQLLSVSLEPPRNGSAAEMHLTAIAEGLRSLGVDVITLWRDPKARAMPGVLKHHWGLVRHLKAADVVYFRWHPLDIFATLACRLASRAYVLEVNGTVDDLISSHPSFRLIKWPLNRFTRWQMAGALGIVAVSSPLGQEVSAREGSAGVPVLVVPNGAPGELFGLRQAVPRDPRYAVYVGTLLARQGISAMLQARHSPFWPDGLELVVAGDGEMRQLVEEHATHGCLLFLGRCDRADALEVMAGATVSLSLQDPDFRRNHVMGLPLKVSESLLLGVPVVGSDVSDMKTLIGGLPGCQVVDVSSPNTVARAVGEVASGDVHLRVSLSEAALKDFSWGSVSVKTANFLRSLLDQ